MQQDMVPEMSEDMDDTHMTGGEGQTLDQIINQNNLELQRRRSTYHPAFQSNGDREQDPHERRSSMMDFPSGKHPDQAGFQFNGSPSQPSIPGQTSDHNQTQKASDPRKMRSRESLALDTRFNQMNPAFGSMPNYSPGIMTSTPLDLDPTSQFLSSNMEIPMSFENAGGERTPMNIQPQIEQRPLFGASRTHQPFSQMFQGLGQDSPTHPGAYMEQSLLDQVSRMRMPETMQNMSGMNGQGTSPSAVMPTTKNSMGPTTTSPAHQQSSIGPVNPSMALSGSYGSGSKATM